MAARAAPAPQEIVERFFNFSLLGMLASGYFAVLGSGALDWPTAVLMFAALCLRGLDVAGLVHLELSGRVVAAATLLYVCFYPIDYFYISGEFLPSAVHLIFFLAAIKILTAKTVRDFTFVKLIAVLELLSAAVLSVSPSFFAFLALFVLFTIAAFSSGEVARSTRLFVATQEARRTLSRAGLRAFPRRLSMLACALFTGILLLTAGMFFVLPRTARAALQRFVPQAYHLPGFSNEVTLGEIGEIKQSSTPVMHIRSYSQTDGLAGLRWRGSALTQFDGKRWYNPPGVEERVRVDHGQADLRTPRLRPGRSLGYEVQLTDIASDVLFFAGSPEAVSIDAPLLWRSTSGSLRISRMTPGRFRYAAYSFLEDEAAPPIAPPRLSPGEQRELLELPRLDERIPRLALDLTAGEPTAEGRARALERRLRRDYGYTLELLSSPVPDPLAYFLFVRRKGHCEYFASAMAVMLRSLGIPSRVVTGFLGGVYNPMSGWQVVRASDAHSWVEAWIPGRGWMTFDPTPADPTAGSGGLFSRVALFLDATDQFWQDWVLGYDLEQQFVLASRVQESSRNLRFDWIRRAGASFESGLRAARSYAIEAFFVLVLFAALVLFGPSALRRWRAHIHFRRLQRGDARASDATLLYERMLRLLERRGFQKPPWLTPAEFARVLPSSDLSMLVEDLTAAYNETRFGGKREAAPRMVRLLQQIETLRVQ